MRLLIKRGTDALSIALSCPMFVEIAMAENLLALLVQ